jgi:hypothetical protein
MLWHIKAAYFKKDKKEQILQFGPKQVFTFLSGCLSLKTKLKVSKVAVCCFFFIYYLL